MSLGALYGNKNSLRRVESRENRKGPERSVEGVVIVEKAVEDAELDSGSALPFASYFCCQNFCFLNYIIRIKSVTFVSAIIPWLFVGNQNYK